MSASSLRRPIAALLAIAAVAAGWLAGPAARAQVDPLRLSYALFLEDVNGERQLAGEVFRDDLDPVHYAEQWVFYPNYVAPTPGNKLVARIVPGFQEYRDSKDFLARVPFDPGAHYQPTEVTTYEKVPAETCLTIERGRQGDVADALINSGTGKDGSADKNYGASGSLTASLDGNQQRQGLLRFDLRDVPRTATVTSATVTLNVLLYGGAPVRAHEVNAPWSEGQVTWNLFGGAYEPSPVATFPAASPGQSTSVDITEVAQRWVSGASDNNGLLLERDAGATVFGSSEGVPLGSRPRLNVCWF